jgi:hypothetical protein
MPDEDICLVFNGVKCKDESTMGELNVHHDNVIALEAIKNSEVSSRTPRPSREPLQLKMERFSPNVAAPGRPFLTHSSSALSSGDENLAPLGNTMGEDDKARVSRQLGTGVSGDLTSNRQDAYEGLASFEDLKNQCAFRDYVHGAIAAYHQQPEINSRRRVLKALE